MTRFITVGKPGVRINVDRIATYSELLDDEGDLVGTQIMVDVGQWYQVRVEVRPEVIDNLIALAQGD